MLSRLGGAIAEMLAIDLRRAANPSNASRRPAQARGEEVGKALQQTNFVARASEGLPISGLDD